jgi:hypothetical protein
MGLGNSRQRYRGAPAVYGSTLPVVGAYNNATPAALNASTMYGNSFSPYADSWGSWNSSLPGVGAGYSPYGGGFYGGSYNSSSGLGPSLGSYGGNGSTSICGYGPYGVNPSSSVLNGMIGSSFPAIGGSNAVGNGYSTLGWGNAGNWGGGYDVSPYGMSYYMR